MVVVVHRSSPPGLPRSTWLQSASRRPTVTTRVGGLHTPGNRNSTPTGPSEPTTALWADLVESPGGFLGKGPRSLGFRPNQPKPELRRGKVCPGCGLERPLVGQCNSCW